MVLYRAKTLQILMELSLSIFSFRDQGLVSNLRTLQGCKRSSFFLKVFVVPYFILETILVIYFESVFVLGVRLRLRFFFFLLISGCPIAQIAAVEMLSLLNGIAFATSPKII